MTNAASFGKSITILLIGAAVGFTGCARQQTDQSNQRAAALAALRAAPPCTHPIGTDQIVNVVVNQGEVEVDHDPVVVRVDSCEQIVWKFDTGKISKLTVSTQWKKKADPGAIDPFSQPPTPTPDPGPPNPFPGVFTGAGDAVVFSATSTTGTLESGLAHRNTPGHEYKFIITVTEVGGSTLEMDPHGRFD